MTPERFESRLSWLRRALNKCLMQREVGMVRVSRAFYEAYEALLDEWYAESCGRFEAWKAENGEPSMERYLRYSSDLTAWRDAHDGDEEGYPGERYEVPWPYSVKFRDPGIAESLCFKGVALVPRRRQLSLPGVG